MARIEGVNPLKKRRRFRRLFEWMRFCGSPCKCLLVLELSVIRLIDGVLETLEDDRGDAVTRSEPDGFAREIGHAEIHGLAMTGIIAGSSENQARRMRLFRN